MYIMKRYSAMVRDSHNRKRVVIILDQPYNTKAEFISELRANGYKVNPKKVKQSDVFDYICNQTNMTPWDWDIKKIPSAE